MMNKELIEAFTIRYGWTPEAVLSISDETIDKMTREELVIYSNRLEQILGSDIDNGITILTQTENGIELPEDYV